MSWIFLAVVIFCNAFYRRKSRVEQSTTRPTMKGKKAGAVSPRAVVLVRCVPCNFLLSRALSLSTDGRWRRLPPQATFLSRTYPQWSAQLAQSPCPSLPPPRPPLVVSPPLPPPLQWLLVCTPHLASWTLIMPPLPRALWRRPSHVLRILQPVTFSFSNLDPIP